MKQRTKRGGSMVGFIVACLIGAILLVGGVYVVKHTNWFHQNPTTKVRTQPVAVNTDKKSSSNNKNSVSSSPDKSASTTKRKTQPTPTKAAAPHKAKSEPKKSSRVTTHSATPTTSQSSSSDSSTTSDLPHTGPSGVLASIIGSGFLTAALLMYMRSRRLIRPFDLSGKPRYNRG